MEFSHLVLALKVAFVSGLFILFYAIFYAIRVFARLFSRLLGN